MTASDEELHRRFAHLEEALLPQVHAIDPAAVERRGRMLRIRRGLVLSAAVVLLVGLVAGVDRFPLGDRSGRITEPVSPAPPPTSTPPSTQQPATTSTTEVPSSTGAPGGRTTSTAPSVGVRFSVAPRTVRPGQPVTLSGSGCAAGARVSFAWVPADVLPASVGDLPPTTARRDGSFQTTWWIEARFRPGRIAITASCAQPKASAATTLTITR